MSSGFRGALSGQVHWHGWWILAAAAISSCGKRGDPLPPLRHYPAAVEELRLRQRGDQLELHWMAPRRNRDGSSQVELKRAEVFRRVLEPEPPPPPEPAAGASQVPPGEVEAPQPSGGSQEAARPAPRPFAEEATLVATLPCMEPGQTMSFSEPLEPSWTGKTVEYAVRHVNRKGRRGGFSPLQRIRPLPPFEPPEKPKVSLDAEGVHLSWRGMARPAAAPEVQLRFNVYRRKAEEAYGEQPLQEAPLVEPRWDDRSFSFSQRWCYMVRAVAVPVAPPEESGSEAPEASPIGMVESRDSNEVCITPEDTFPPPPPEGLVAVRVAQGILLSWEEVEAEDLAGYRLYRSTRREGPFELLTEKPLRFASFTDARVPSGTMLFYAVSAVDRADPPNESPKSEAVTVAPQR